MRLYDEKHLHELGELEQDMGTLDTVTDNKYYLEKLKNDSLSKIQRPYLAGGYVRLGWLPLSGCI